MQSRVESKRSTVRPNLISTDRPDSSQLVDLHVYIIPKKIWKNRQNLAENVVMEQAISAGFVRVPENLTIHDLRRFIIDICSEDIDFPKEFIYLRSVGRCLTKVKQQQEKELKVKNYRPPTTFAPEIFILEEGPDDNLSRESPLTEPLMRSEIWIQPVEGPPLSYPLFNQQSLPIPSFSTKISPRDLVKIREEQQRLYLRQIELARKRHEMEKQHKKEQEAAIKIQTVYRNYRIRQDRKQREADAIEIKRLQKQARKLARRKADVEHAEERQVHDIVRLSNSLEELRLKRMELEANRELVVHRMQQLHTQIIIRRKEEKDLWKEKYIIEKKRITSFEEQNHILLKNSSDIHNQLEEAKIRLNNTTKLRQQAEYESRLLRQKLQQISSTLNVLERYRLPKQQQQTEPISFDVTVQY